MTVTLHAGREILEMLSDLTDGGLPGVPGRLDLCDWTVRVYVLSAFRSIPLVEYSVQPPAGPLILRSASDIATAWRQAVDEVRRMVLQVDPELPGQMVLL